MSNMHGIHPGQVWDDEVFTLLVVQALPYDYFNCLILSLNNPGIRAKAPPSLQPGKIIKLTGFLIKHSSKLISEDPAGPLSDS